METYVVRKERVIWKIPEPCHMISRVGMIYCYGVQYETQKASILGEHGYEPIRFEVEKLLIGRKESKVTDLIAVDPLMVIFVDNEKATKRLEGARHEKAEKIG